jgi:hypothetical protein
VTLQKFRQLDRRVNFKAADSRAVQCRFVVDERNRPEASARPERDAGGAAGFTCAVDNQRLRALLTHPIEQVACHEPTAAEQKGCERSEDDGGRGVDEVRAEEIVGHRASDRCGGDAHE